MAAEGNAAHRERDWQEDMYDRVAGGPPWAAVPAVVASLLTAIWTTPWIFLILVVSELTWAASLAVSTRRGSYRLLAGAWTLSQIGGATTVWLAGAGQTAGVLLLVAAVPAAALGFSRRMFIATGAFTTALVVVLTLLPPSPLVADPGPAPLFLALGGLASLTMFLQILRQASFEHRTASVLDPLTGSLNRTALHRRARDIEAQSSESGEPVCLLLVDADHFKQINDQHGHATGDDVLAELAARIRKVVRRFDAVYRIGGEEFLVVLTDADEMAGRTVAGRIIQAVRAQPVAGLRLTVSVGMAVAGPGAIRFGESFSVADAALYEAKRGGRDRLSVAHTVATGRPVSD